MKHALVAVAFAALLLASCDSSQIGDGTGSGRVYTCLDSCVIQVNDTTLDTVGRWVLDTIALRVILDANGLTALGGWEVVGSADVDTCGRIVTLDLAALNISCLPDTVAALTELRELDLYNNRGVDCLPPAIGRLANLTTLKVQRCSLTRLPDSLCNLAALRTLYVHDNLLTCLPDSIGRLSSLAELELTDNHLDSLPQSIKRLSVLPRYLAISHNHLCSADSADAAWIAAHCYEGSGWMATQYGCGQLVNDTVLLRGLLDTYLDSLPVCSVATIVNGRVSLLDLSGRALDSLPAGIFGLTGLRRLDASDNSIDSVPFGLDSLASLRVLDLSGNQLRKLPPGLDGLDSLDTLDLSANLLADDSIVVWLLPPKPRVLDLSGNPTLGVVDASVVALRTLRRLDLSGDSLAQLPELDSLTLLDVLDISGNRLTTLPASVSVLVALDTLDFSHNRVDSLPLSIVTFTGLTPKMVTAYNRLCVDSLTLAMQQWLTIHAVEISWPATQACP